MILGRLLTHVCWKTPLNIILIDAGVPDASCPLLGRAEPKAGVPHPLNGDFAFTVHVWCSAHAVVANDTSDNAAKHMAARGVAGELCVEDLI